MMCAKNTLFKKIVIIIFIICFWSFFIEPHFLTVKNYKIKNDYLKGLKIVYAADLHLQPCDEQRLKRIVKKINDKNPDIVLLGGDFVNGQSQEATLPMELIAKELSTVKSRYGIYCVLGNHDWWYNGELVIKELKNNKINVLLNENKEVKLSDGRSIFIAGVEDLSTREPDIKKALKNTKEGVVLLTHSPDIFPEINESVDLILAGHTHGGQVNIPFFGPIFVPSDYGSKYAGGLIKEDGKTMIVSKGIGTSSVHVRLNCVPEILFIEFN